MGWVTKVCGNLVGEVARLGPGWRHSHRGRIALERVAIEIIQERREARQRCLFPADDKDLTQLPHYVRLFLRRMRENFPEVVLRGIYGEAATERWDWATRKSGLNEFRGRQAGQLFLNERVRVPPLNLPIFLYPH